MFSSPCLQQAAWGVQEISIFADARGRADSNVRLRRRAREGAHEEEETREQETRPEAGAEPDRNDGAR